MFQYPGGSPHWSTLSLVEPLTVSMHHIFNIHFLHLLKSISAEFFRIMSFHVEINGEGYPV